jgi:hypothetical protein
MNQYPGQKIAQAVVENLLDIVLGAIEPQERGFEQMGRWAQIVSKVEKMRRIQKRRDTAVAAQIEAVA